jgi:uncharacterized protein
MGKLVTGAKTPAPEPVVFDCLEFDRDLRLVDPIDELAFLSMECERLGAAEVEPVLFDTYSRLTGDRPPPELVRFYKAYRAYFRALQAAWHVDEELAAAEASRWIHKAADYLERAAAAIG